MQTENRQPTELEQAIAAKSAVVDQLAYEQGAAAITAHNLAVRLVAAQNELTALRRQQAEL
jgi:hypothetical protein